MTASLLAHRAHPVRVVRTRGPRPIPTTQTVAMRTAEAPYRRQSGGDPWVRSESPPPSTDPRLVVGPERLGR
jgi:hypothetical protein